MKEEIVLKRYNKSMHHSYSFGAAGTIELLKHTPESVIKIILSNRCKERNIPIEVNEKAINRIADKQNIFVIGVFEKFKKNIVSSASHIVLVNPSNMGNLGTIIRSCVGFGINNLALITPCVDIFDPKAVRASMGAVFNLNFSHYNTFDNYLEENDARKIYTLMLKGSTDINKLQRDKSERFSLVFGNEATGLDDSFLEKGKSVLIKHTDNIDSLNLPVAVGISIYAFLN
jgi:RNA methyltransferase, TrmH family